ncbi:MAG: hypothetical protein ACK4YP_27350, partial [Myxococcota bacterium]
HPVLAHNLGLLLVVFTNVLAAWALGDTLAPRRRGLLAAGIVGAVGFWTWQLGVGALTAAWVAPGLAALAAARTGRRGMFVVAALLGLVGAPIVMAAALLAGRVLWGRGADDRGGLDDRALLAAAAACLGVALLLPAAVTGGAVTLPPGVLAWPASGDAAGLPLVFVLGVGAAWSGRLLGARGGPALGTPAARALAVAAVGTVIVAVGPLARDADGAVVTVASFGIPLGPSSAWLSGSAHALLSSALVVGVLAALALASRARFGRAAEIALVGLALVEARLQGAAGQPVALWAGEAWPVPAALADLGRAPGSGGIVQLPFLGTDDGLVGFVPFHRQPISGAPGQHVDGPVREALGEARITMPAFKLLAHPEEATGPFTHVL